MESKRLPNEQSLEELLKTLEDTKDESIVGVTDDVFYFISAFNILPGENKVKKGTLHQLYKTWSKQPVNRKVFSEKLAEHFLTAIIMGTHYFKINLDSMSVRKETLKYLEGKKTKKLKSPHFQKHFEQFLKEHNLKQGKAWVEGFILFYVYDKWCYETNKKTQLANSFFISFCKLYFKHKQNNDKAKLWFGVNDEFMMNHLTPEKIKTIQQARDKKYEKKQKIKNKIPSTKT
jgi:hypothetical protein